MARVSIKPIEPLELEFTDGTVKEALFNNEAFIIYTEEFGKLDVKKLEELKDKPYDLISRFLYCGMKVVDKSITLDEARSITIGGGEPLATEILNSVIDNFMAVADEDSKKKFLKEVEKFNKALLQMMNFGKLFTLHIVLNQAEVKKSFLEIAQARQLEYQK